MRMPQDFVDAINAAVRAVNPDAGEMISGSMTLGTDFDEWLGPAAMMKYGFGPMPPEDAKAFAAKFDERRNELKAALVASSVEIEKRRMAGDLQNEYPRTKAVARHVSDVIGELERKEKP